MAKYRKTAGVFAINIALPAAPPTPNNVKIYNYMPGGTLGWGKVCCRGTVAYGTMGTPVLGKAYAGLLLTVPGNPLTESPQFLGTVTSNNYYFQGCLDGATGNDTGTSQNTVVVWAQNAGVWVAQAQLFNGQYANTTDCPAACG